MSFASTPVATKAKMGKAQSGEIDTAQLQIVGKCGDFVVERYQVFCRYLESREN